MRPSSAHRHCLCALLCSLALSAPSLAQSPPPDLIPLPEAPPPPSLDDGAAQDSQAAAKPGGKFKVEEFRARGQRYMIKITPDFGQPYYLVNPKGEGGSARHEAGGGEKTLTTPLWVIHSY